MIFASTAALRARSGIRTRCIEWNGLRRGLSDVAYRNWVCSELQQLDTAAICDADKVLFSQSINNDTGVNTTYEGIRLLHSNVRPINGQHQRSESSTSSQVMVGVARTVKCTKRNDFLAVFRGLMEAQEGDVLMVDTAGSDRAVAGELFSLQAMQNGICGIVIDGPMRDTVHVRELPLASIRCYSTSVTPYAGTTQSPGEVDVPISCGGVMVNPGDIVVGDNDGVVVADAKTLELLLPLAKMIFEAEEKIKNRLLKGDNLKSLTNCEEHIAARLAGRPSSLSFTV